MMKHFTTIEWLKRARGLASADQVSDMEQHLTAGCTSCAEISAQMNTIVAMAKRESSYEPPAQATRLAKSLFAASKLAASPGAEHEFLKLMFDSVTQPLLAGVRGAAAGRQL